MAIKRSDIKHCPVCGGPITLKEDVVANVEKLVLSDKVVDTSLVMRTFRCKDSQCGYWGFWEM